jgi:hypothetical protein
MLPKILLASGKENTSLGMFPRETYLPQCRVGELPRELLEDLPKSQASADGM